MQILQSIIITSSLYHKCHKKSIKAHYKLFVLYRLINYEHYFDEKRPVFLFFDGLPVPFFVESFETTDDIVRILKNQFAKSK